MSSSVQAGGYVVPAYRAPDDTSWYHFLHGNVPGHQIDFMYRPEVPQGALSRQHFSHLARLMKYIEPESTGAYAFAIGNLSRDDTQHEPGHGGVALIFGLRIRDVTDHAGRQDPPFAHGIAAIDRELDYTTILKASLAFSRHVLGAAESAEWYRTYVQCADISPADVEYVLAGYVSTFSDLPLPPASSMGPKWVAGAAPQPKRIVITHPEDTPFEQIADCAARIAAMLYRSDIRWTSISNGREADVPNGVSIRLFAENSLGPNDAPDGVRRLDEVPEDEAELAKELFGAKSAEKKAERVLGWRERFGANAPSSAVPESAPATPVQAEDERPAWEGRANRPPYVPLDPTPAGDEVTELWKGRPEREPAGEIDIPVDCLSDEPAPSVEAQPVPLAAVAVNGEAVPSGAAELRPAIIENQHAPPAPAPAMLVRATPVPMTPTPVTPAPTTPVPVTPTPAVPLITPTNTLIMKAAADPVMEMPRGPAAQPQIPVAEWQPSPNFRRPQAPMLRWTLMAMAAAGVILAILYLVFADDPPTPGAPGASAAEPSPSIQPTAPAPSVTSDAVQPKATATTPAPQVSTAPSKPEPPPRGGKPSKGTNTKKIKDPFDAPLNLGK